MNPTPATAVLAAIAADPSVASALSLVLQQQFQATCGRRRVFLSERDKYAYERGFAHWPEPLPAALASTPSLQGWYDAEHAQELIDEERADAAFEAIHGSAT